MSSIVPKDQHAIEPSVPEPLAPLTERQLSAENLRIIRETAQAQKTPRLTRIMLSMMIKRIERQLRAAQYDEILKESRRLMPVVAKARKARQILQSDPEHEQARAFLYKYKSEIHRYKSIQPKLNELQPLADRRDAALARLRDHQIWLEVEQETKIIQKRQRQEARIYAEIITERLKQLGFSHTEQIGNKSRTHTIDFELISVGMDTIYYKIAASYETPMRNWKTNVPRGVRLMDVVSPETCAELTVSCQRQVTGLWNRNGAFLLVHRLDSPDGILEFLEWGSMMLKYPRDDYQNLPFPVGVSLNRVSEWRNLEDDPHWLIAGHTKSGKSNFINNMISCWISMHTPKDLRLLLIDLKGGLEFGDYSTIPHLYREVARTVEATAAALAELEALMNLRFADLDGVARDFLAYKKRTRRDDYPRIVCVFDEGASFTGFGDTTRQILHSLGEIARKGRAVGIHIVFCAQRPDSAVLSGNIKAQFSGRVTFRMGSVADSVTVIGTKDAQDLPDIKGRAILVDGPDKIQLQTPYIDDETIRQCIKAAEQMPEGNEIVIPQNAYRMAETWDVNRLIEFSFKHMDVPGIVSARRLFDALKSTGFDVTFSQVNKLVEQIMSAEQVTYEGEIYVIKKQKGNRSVLTKID